MGRKAKRGKAKRRELGRNVDEKGLRKVQVLGLGLLGGSRALGLVGLGLGS